VSTPSAALVKKELIQQVLGRAETLTQHEELWQSASGAQGVSLSTAMDGMDSCAPSAWSLHCKAAEVEQAPVNMTSENQQGRSDAAVQSPHGHLSAPRPRLQRAVQKIQQTSIWRVKAAEVEPAAVDAVAKQRQATCRSDAAEESQTAMDAGRKRSDTQGEVVVAPTSIAHFSSPFAQREAAVSTTSIGQRCSPFAQGEEAVMSSQPAQYCSTSAPITTPQWHRQAPALNSILSVVRLRQRIRTPCSVQPDVEEMVMAHNDLTPSQPCREWGAEPTEDRATAPSSTLSNEMAAVASTASKTAVDQSSRNSVGRAREMALSQRSHGEGSSRDPSSKAVLAPPARCAPACASRHAPAIPISTTTSHANRASGGQPAPAHGPKRPLRPAPHLARAAPVLPSHKPSSRPAWTSPSKADEAAANGVVPAADKHAGRRGLCAPSPIAHSDRTIDCSQPTHGHREHRPPAPPAHGSREQRPAPRTTVGAYQLPKASPPVISRAHMMRLQGQDAGMLKPAHVTAKEARDAGYTNKDLVSAGFSAHELHQAGSSAAQLKRAGCTASELLEAGCTKHAVITSGYTRQELLDAGVSTAELPGGADSASKPPGGAGSSSGPPGVVDEGPLDTHPPSGTSPANKPMLRQTTGGKLSLERVGHLATLPTLYRAKDKPGGSSQPSQRPRSGSHRVTSGPQRAKLIRVMGDGASALIKEGISADDGRQAGFSAQEMLEAGYTASDLIEGGYTAVQLKWAGCSASAMLQAGADARHLREASYEVAEARAAGLSATALASAGYTSRQLLNGGFSLHDMRNAGVSAADLMCSGCPERDMTDAGYGEGELASARGDS